MSSGEGFGDIPLTDTDEPSVLGASATIEAPRRTRKRRQRVRRRRRKQRIGTDGTIEVVYEPHVATVPPLRTYFSELWERRAFLVALARSDIRGSRSSTTLGSLWALLDPMIMAGIYFFLFSVIRKGGDRGSDFIPLIVGGVLAFQLTGNAITAGGSSVRGGKNLMLNSTFPRALLPLSAIYKLVLGFLPAIPIILGSLLIFNDWNPAAAFSIQLIWFFPVVAIQLTTGIGLALLISTLVVFVTDATNVMQYVSRVLFFSTPIIYPYYTIPDRILEIVKWQPIFGIFVGYQKMLLGIRPDLGYLAISAAWSVVLICLGFSVFLRYERQFAGQL